MVASVPVRDRDYLLLLALGSCALLIRVRDGRSVTEKEEDRVRGKRDESRGKG